MRPGLYAARVIGRPPRDVLRKLKEKGVPYVPRDDVAGENAQNQEDDDSVDDEDDYEDDGMVVEDDAEEGEEDLEEDRGRGGGARTSGGRKTTIRFEVSEDEDSDEE
jgi:hypothetical protein